MRKTTVEYKETKRKTVLVVSSRIKTAIDLIYILLLVLFFIGLFTDPILTLPGVLGLSYLFVGERIMDEEEFQSINNEERT